MKVIICQICRVKYTGETWDELIKENNLVLLSNGYSCCEKKSKKTFRSETKKVKEKIEDFI